MTVGVILRPHSKSFSKLLIRKCRKNLPLWNTLKVSVSVGMSALTF